MEIADCKYAHIRIVSQDRGFEKRFLSYVGKQGQIIEDSADVVRVRDAITRSEVTVRGDENFHVGDDLGEHNHADVGGKSRAVEGPYSAGKLNDILDVGREDGASGDFQYGILKKRDGPGTGNRIARRIQRCYGDGHGDGIGNPRTTRSRDGRNGQIGYIAVGRISQRNESRGGIALGEGNGNRLIGQGISVDTGVENAFYLQANFISVTRHV